MARVTTCLDCGTPTYNAFRCRSCGGTKAKKVRNPAYDDPRWKRLSREKLAIHRATYGNWCPGYRRPGHASPDLTLDHVRPMSMGGALLGPTQVLCRSCNDVKRHVDRRPG